MKHNLFDIARNEVKSLNSRPNNSTKSLIRRLRDKGFYRKRNGDLKRKLVVCLVKTVGLLP